METNWTLEILKLAAQALTPIVVGFIGWKVSKRLKEMEQAQWGNRKLTEKRIEIYETISPLLNRLYCYFVFVGDWQTHSPKEIIQTKRCLDHEVHVNKFLLEPEVFSAYMSFMDALFDTYTGVGKDARLKTAIVSPHGDRRSSPSFEWKDEFRECFNSRDVAPADRIGRLYETVMMAQRVGIKA